MNQLARTPKQIGIRPEHCRVAASDGVAPLALANPRLVMTENLGDRSYGYIAHDGGEMTVLLGEDGRADQLSTLCVQTQRIIPFDSDGIYIA